MRTLTTDLERLFDGVFEHFVVEHNVAVVDELILVDPRRLVHPDARQVRRRLQELVRVE